MVNLRFDLQFASQVLDKVAEEQVRRTSRKKLAIIYLVCYVRLRFSVITVLVAVIRSAAEVDILGGSGGRCRFSDLTLNLLSLLYFPLPIHFLFLHESLMSLLEFLLELCLVQNISLHPRMLHYSLHVYPLLRVRIDHFRDEVLELFRRQKVGVARGLRMPRPKLIYLTFDN